MDKSSQLKTEKKNSKKDINLNPPPQQTTFHYTLNVSMADGQDSTFVELQTISLAADHRIDYIACVVELPNGQTARANIETPDGFAPLIMIPQGTYPTNRAVFVASQQIAVTYPPKLAGETSPTPSRRVQIWRSSNSETATIRIFIRGTFEQ